MHCDISISQNHTLLYLQMTGRKGRVVCTDDGISYESRSEADVPLEILNLTEKQRFMDGEKVSLLEFAADNIFKFSRFY